MASTKVAELQKKLDGSEDAETIMINILEIFRDSELVPDAGKYYTFIYIPKTTGITYDEHPLVAVTAVERWGFKGINFHWGQVRNYTWEEIIGKLHVIGQSEIGYLRSLKYAKFVTK